MLKWINLLLTLTKFRISFFATLSASAGFLLARQVISEEMITPVLGIFFLACGSSALNQYQERKIDGLMERTRGRPLPSGRLNSRIALCISSVLIVSGFLILSYGTGLVALALGLFAVLWYNGTYTYLKRKTAFAVIPGTLIGAIPPVLGWVSGGGSILDYRIWGIAFFIFIWQIPHFWLIFLDFARDYERAGLPSLTKIFSTEQLRRIIFFWLLSTAASSLIIPLFGFVNFHASLLLLTGGTAWFVWNATIFFRSYSEGASLRAIFMRLNIYALLVISLLSLDKLFDSGYIELTVISRMLAIMGIKHV